MVGVAQSAFLLPATLFMLLGGTMSDHLGARRVAVIAQSIAVVPPLMLAGILFFNKLNLPLMIVYAASIGTLQAFITPARDAILNSVARGDIQRTVVKFTLVQFLTQMVGFAFAGTAQRIGGVPILIVQALIIALGAWSLSRVPQLQRDLRPDKQFVPKQVANSIVVGCRAVLKNPAMRAVALQNMFVGICFMGSYAVTVPLLIRDIYQGSSFDIALINLVNSTGLVVTITLLLLTKGIRRAGRALLIAHGLGAVFLGIAGIGFAFPVFAALLFIWGTCGGIAISMARSVMLENAPEDLRGRVMGFYAFSFMGSGPIGALLWGFTAGIVGPKIALVLAGALMFIVVVIVSSRSRLWRM